MGRLWDVTYGQFIRYALNVDGIGNKSQPGTEAGTGVGVRDKIVIIARPISSCALVKYSAY